MAEDFAIEFDSATALKRVQDSDLSSTEKRHYTTFIQNFKDLEFFANTEFGLHEIELDHNIDFPSTLRNYRMLLANVLYGKSAQFKFGKFTQQSPRSDKLNQLWYSIGLVGIPSEGRERDILTKSNPEYSFIPISTVTGHPGADSYFLSVNQIENDEKIYEFNILDLYDDFNSGEPIDQSAYPIFDSYPEMLANISEVRYKNGKKETILKAQKIED